MRCIQLWQWPNILALDAVLIALAWQAVFSHAIDKSVSPNAQLVLGLSVWLTYVADRLFDVAKRPLSQLQSSRHSFAKQHAPRLWKIWWGVLFVNITTALLTLPLFALRNGIVLLILCLAYTALNQALSRRFFPKELCVALIFTGGTVVFLLPSSELWAPAFSLALLCLINCLAIGSKERLVDAALNVHSLSHIPTWLLITLEVGCALSIWTLQPVYAWPFALSLGVLATIHGLQKRLSVEQFRILIDGSLLVGPAFCYWLT